MTVLTTAASVRPSSSGRDKIAPSLASPERTSRASVRGRGELAGRGVVMLRAAAARRVGVLAPALRAREHVRRIFRSLGYAPLVFGSLDELGAMGPDASTLDMLLLGGAAPTAADDPTVLDSVRDMLGPTVPVLHVRMPTTGCANPLHVAENGVVTASPRFFGDLYAAVRSFLGAIGLERPPPRLAWNGYSFDPVRTVVAFANSETPLDPVAFDVALELFFHAGRTVTKRELSLMLPAGEEGATRFRIDNIGLVVRELRASLRLRGRHGWRLETLPHVGYRLVRVEGQPSTKDRVTAVAS